MCSKFLSLWNVFFPSNELCFVSSWVHIRIIIFRKFASCVQIGTCIHTVKIVWENPILKRNWVKRKHWKKRNFYFCDFNLFLVIIMISWYTFFWKWNLLLYWYFIGIFIILKAFDETENAFIRINIYSSRFIFYANIFSSTSMNENLF